MTIAKKNQKGLTPVKKEFRIVGVQALGMGLVALQLMGKLPKLPITEREGMTEEERIGMRMGRGVLQGMLQAQPGFTSGGPPLNYPTVLVLTKEEYEALGNPTVEEEIVIEIPVLKKRR